jgi:hypothetical protein
MLQEINVKLKKLTAILNRIKMESAGTIIVPYSRVNYYPPPG